MSDAKIAEMNFEDALAALEEVVKQLEDGKVPLERAIDLYERGETLRRHCEERLKAAELRVEKVVGGGPGTEPFEAG